MYKKAGNMDDVSSQDKRLPARKSVFEYLVEIIGWIQIMASPFIIGLLIGVVIYFSRPGKLTMIIGIVVTLAGLCIGIMWATRVWRKKGTVQFMSGIMATPELENKVEE